MLPCSRPTHRSDRRRSVNEGFVRMRRELIPDLLPSRDKSRDDPDKNCSCPEVERSRDVLCRPLVRNAVILKSRIYHETTLRDCQLTYDAAEGHCCHGLRLYKGPSVQTTPLCDVTRQVAT